MNNIKLKICYNGSGYNGWQRQLSTNNTIQQHLEEGIERVLAAKINLAASGRTDAGVHALGQVANFKTEREIRDFEEFVQLVNREIPDTIKIMEAKKVNMDFHSRLSAKEKTYCYRICMLEKPRVFNRDRMYPYGKKMDIEKMQNAANVLFGEHDFRAFSSEKDKQKSTVRIIKEISIFEEDGMLSIYYTGNGFLYNMVRILTGTLIEVGMGKKQISDIEECLKTKERSRAGFMAPACGLTLMQVFY